MDVAVGAAAVGVVEIVVGAADAGQNMIGLEASVVGEAGVAMAEMAGPRAVIDQSLCRT